jgi:hypothetical protein
MQTQRQGTRLVSFLGLGPPKSDPPHYIPARYAWQGRTSPETALFQRALCEVETVDSVVVLGTSAVKARWEDTGLLGRELGRSYAFELISDGATEEELWGIFNAVLAALEDAPIHEETTRPQRILVDVTHGFRVQPMLGIGAVAFVLSEWARLQSDGAPEVRMVYGAWEARDATTQIAPVWDLTSFLTVGRWNAAIDAFMRFGRADDFERLASLDATSQVDGARARGVANDALATYRYGRDLGRAAREFADALSLARFRDLLSSTWADAGSKKSKKRTGAAARLGELLDDPRREELFVRLPLLRAPMERLREWARRLEVPTTRGPAWHGALIELAKLYGSTERYSEQIAVIREGVVDRFAHLTGRDWAAEPGQPGYAKARKEVDTLLGRLARMPTAPGDTVRDRLAAEGLPTGNDVVACVDFSSRTVDPRNDIHHGGLRDQPLEAASLRDRLEKLMREFAELLSA